MLFFFERERLQRLKAAIYYTAVYTGTENIDEVYNVSK